MDLPMQCLRSLSTYLLFQLSQTTLWVVKIWHFVNILWCIKLSTFYPWIFLYLTQNLFRGIFFTFVDIQNQGSRKQGGNNIRFPPVHLQPFSAVPSLPFLLRIFLWNCMMENTSSKTPFPKVILDMEFPRRYPKFI